MRRNYEFKSKRNSWNFTAKICIDVIFMNEANIKSLQYLRPFIHKNSDAVLF